MKPSLILRAALIFSLSFGFFACSSAPSDPLEATFPTLPPVGGAVVTHAGQLTAANFATERVTGPASQGLVGDYFMRNDKIRVVVQAPGRAIGPVPFGGNIIDADWVAEPAGDQLGEISPVFHSGRTFSVDRAEVIRDGSQGGPAVLRFWGHDARNEYLNLPGLTPFFQNQATFTTADLQLRVATTYVLMPGESMVRVTYSFHNTQTLKPFETIWGTLTDTGAGPEIFHPLYGYGEISIDDLIQSANYNTFPFPGEPNLSVVPADYYALQGDRISYGIIPNFRGKPLTSSFVPTSGLVIEFYNTEGLSDALVPREGQRFVVAPGQADSREVDIAVGRDVAGITQQKHQLFGDTVVAFSGVVEGAGAGVRVAVDNLDLPRNKQRITSCTTDASGHFQGAVPAGRYGFQAEGDSLRRGAQVEMVVPGSDVHLSLPTFGQLAYTVKDDIGNSIPAKIIVVGVPANPADLRFRDTFRDPLPLGVAGWKHSLSGTSTSNTRYDAPIALKAGKYRVIVSRGPEWSRHEEVVTIGTGTSTVNAVLYRVAPTPGYIAADFHQHSHISPDAYAAPEDRVVSYLADGVDLISSSEHDVLFDYKPLIEKLGATALLDSMIGVESTPWDYGHYIGFPFTIDANSPNGGAVDWAGGESGFNLTPPMLFEALRQRGARVIQVNHPRALPASFFTFQKSFDQAGLTFDFGTRSFFGNSAISQANDFILDFPDGAPRFAPTFDLLEVWNGFDIEGPLENGERPDRIVDRILSDWMNFMSFGYAPTPTGVSDAHGRINDVGGMPRTLVRVPDDSAQAVAHGGLQEPIIATLKGQGVARDVVVTNTPFLQFTVDDKSPGQTIVHSDKAKLLHIQAKVVTPTWAPVHTIEVFANNTFNIPLPANSMVEPLVPLLCFTTRQAANASARCKMALGGVRAMTVTTTNAKMGEVKSARYEITVEADINIADILLRNRAGARGEDLWLFARTFGDVGIFPVVPKLIAPLPNMTDLVENPNYTGIGVPAAAFTNAVFVDVDGNGWKGPFQP